MDTDPSHWISALESSHERLASLVEPLDGDSLRSPSYASEWSIAQVLAHLGSGSDVFSLLLDAGLSGDQPPGREQFEPIWAAWNAKPVEAQAADAVAGDAVFLNRIDSLDEGQREALRLSTFGMEIDFVMLSRMRLGELAMHTWDIAVALDPAANVDPEAVELLVDTLDQLVSRVGKPTGAPQRVAIHTTDPDRSFVLDITDSVTLTGGGGSDAGSGGAGLPELHMPAEALLRLVYGRLDPDHSPPIAAGAVDLDVLRNVFPGV